MKVQLLAGCQTAELTAAVASYFFYLVVMGWQDADQVVPPGSET